MNPTAIQFKKTEHAPCEKKAEKKVSWHSRAVEVICEGAVRAAPAVAFVAATVALVASVAVIKHISEIDWKDLGPSGNFSTKEFNIEVFDEKEKLFSFPATLENLADNLCQEIIFLSSTDATLCEKAPSELSKFTPWILGKIESIKDLSDYSSIRAQVSTATTAVTTSLLFGKSISKGSRSEEIPLGSLSETIAQILKSIS